MDPAGSHPPTLGSLWRQFLPLSLSDVTMAAGDPLMATTLAHLPEARANLAAVGIAKSLAVFFESPIIMMLHASTVLSAAEASRRALWRFMLVLCGGLTAALAIVASPTVFAWLGTHVLGVDPALAERSRFVLSVMCLWPAAIGWRRYFQGQLIRAGRGDVVGRAGVARLALVATLFGAGLLAGVPGAFLAGATLVAGVLLEAVWVTAAVRNLAPDEQSPLESSSAKSLPTDVGGVWRFYWPLATSMLVVWSGRAVLVALVARAVDGPVALAAWPAGWGLVLLVANATRMVQQVVIRQRDAAPPTMLVLFALSVGMAFAGVLMVLVYTPVGRPVIAAFVGHDPGLVAAITPVLALGATAPLIIAFQNALQGFLIGAGRTGAVNVATWCGTAVLLGGAGAGVAAGQSGGVAAAGAMIAALVVEAGVLAAALRHGRAAPA